MVCFEVEAAVTCVSPVPPGDIPWKGHVLLTASISAPHPGGLMRKENLAHLVLHYQQAVHSFACMTTLVPHNPLFKGIFL